MRVIKCTCDRCGAEVQDGECYSATGFPSNDACERCAALWNAQREVWNVQYREWVDRFMGRPFQLGDRVRVRAEVRAPERKPFVLDRFDGSQWSGVDDTDCRWDNWTPGELEKVE